MDFINNFVLSFVVITVVVNLQECFCGVITLDGEDFEENVFSDDTPWIVTIQGRVSEEVVHDVNEEIKDRINIGIIEEKELATTLKKIAPSRTFIKSNFHIFPFGAKTNKLGKMESSGSVHDAIAKAYLSIPDITNKLPNIIDDKNAMLRNFIQEAYSSLPPKFPVVLFTDDSATPLFYKLISLKFTSVFHFGHVQNPPLATQAVYAISKLPRLIVLLTELPKDGAPKIKPIPYDDNIHGPLSYPRVMRFLYLVHKQFFKELLQHSRSPHGGDFVIEELFEPHMIQFPELLQLPNQQQETTNKKLKAKVSDHAKRIKTCPCPNNIDVCIIIVDKERESLQGGTNKEIMTNVTRIRKAIQDAGKTVETYEIDLGCNEEMEMQFDIYSEDVPVFLLLRPKHRIYTSAVIEELTLSIEEFSEKALLGKIAHEKYTKLPAFRIGKCPNDHEHSGENKIKREL